jgi:DNA-binding CsgD family transcriptional regulator
MLVWRLGSGMIEAGDMAIAPETWRELLEAVYEINAARNHGDFATAVVAGMRKLIAADVTVFQVLDRARERIKTQMHPPEPFTEEEVAYYTAHPEEFALVAYYDRTQDTGARRLSDVIGMEELLADRYYLMCLARQGLKYCVALPIMVDATTVVALSFNRRESDFTKKDCDLLNAFGPHFRLAWERHENPWAEQRQLAAQRRLQSLGLSPRESETLFWMAEGKQNREIATILGVQLGTVQEYVAGVLGKLEQENRHAATVFAIGVLRER